MLLRTITVENGQREALNAAVLCSLAIPEIEANVLVYTLNESTSQGTSKVYVAALAPQVDGGYQLGSLDSHGWQATRPVLRQIIEGARATNRTAAGAYHFVRIERLGRPLTPHPTCLEQHHALALGPGAIQKLLACRSSDNFGEPFYAPHLLPYRPYEPASPPAAPAGKDASIARQAGTALPPDLPPKTSPDSEQLLRDVQATLNILVDKAGLFAQHTQDRADADGELARRRSQLEERERQVQAREAALDQRAAELDVRVEKLAMARDRLRSLLQAHSESVHVNNTLEALSTTALPGIDD